MPGTPRYDHYKVLGVAHDAAPAAIKRAYRALAKVCHPDHDPSPGAAHRFRVVHDAYHTLIDPGRRARFDAQVLFHRPVQVATTHQATGRARAARRNVSHGEGWSVPRFAFIGLHVTGLLFGSSTVAAALFGVTWLEWPWYTMVFCLPGAAAIPESIEGLRM